MSSDDFEDLDAPKKSVRTSPHLKSHQFQPGNKLAAGHGGRRGQAKGRQQMRTLIRHVLETTMDLENPLTLEKYKMTLADAMILKLVKRALDGNLPAISMILDRLDGKVPDMVQLGNIENQALIVENTVQHDFSKLSVEDLLNVRNTLQKTVQDVEIIDPE